MTDDVTPAMIEVGREILWSYNREYDGAGDEIVVEIYRAMRAAAPKVGLDTRIADLERRMMEHDDGRDRVSNMFANSLNSINNRLEWMTWQPLPPLLDPCDAC